MLTIRPSPRLRMAAKAARQQRNEPVRLTSSISAQISGVVWSKGADRSTAAAQTRAAGLPTSSAAAKRRSTSSTLLTSVGTGVAAPPASRMRPATASRASRSRAASTTWAPAAATASAVAAPIPRLAPVTTADRPASQCLASATDRGPGTNANHAPVDLFVSVQARLEIQVAFGMAATVRPRQSGRHPDGVGRRMDVVGCAPGAGHPVGDHLAERAAPEGDHGSAARLRFGGDHPEGLLPPRGAENDRRARHRLPERRSRHSGMYADARLGPSRVDSPFRVLGVIGVAVYVDADPRRTGDVDGFGCSLLRAQPAGEDGAVPLRSRPVDATRRDAGREDRVD